MRESRVSRIFIGGLATEYCVKDTVLDGLCSGFAMVLLSDASRGINVRADDSEKAVSAMRIGGAKIATLDDFVEPTDIPLEEPEAESTSEKPLTIAEMKKKTRMRSRGLTARQKLSDKTSTSLLAPKSNEPYIIIYCKVVKNSLLTIFQAKSPEINQPIVTFAMMKRCIIQNCFFASELTDISAPA